MAENFPRISVLLPTLNAGRVLGQCLKAIKDQNYPREKIEIIIADGGSKDKTLAIAGKYGAKIYSNPLKTGEAGKAVALSKARGELSTLIDSDNVLPDKNWFRKMIQPFQDREIIGAEPWKFSYRKKDALVDRYSALIGANDPYCYFVGNYDKYSFLSGKWTGLNPEEEDKGDYLKVKIKGDFLPTIGANGTIWRTRFLKKAVGKSKYLFDTDVAYLLKPFYFAKVKAGIIHLYCPQIKDFYRKQKRRARDFFFQEGRGERKGTYQCQRRKQLYFILSTVLFSPLVFQSLKGYFKKPDRAWFFHPPACLITLWVYGRETIRAFFKKEEFSRERWSQ